MQPLLQRQEGLRETVKKGLCPFLTKGLQSAARTSCPLPADKTHTCSLIGIFCQVQEVNCPEGARETTLGCSPTENDQNPFAACGRQTLRGLFDTLTQPLLQRQEGLRATVPKIPPRKIGGIFFIYSSSSSRENSRVSPHLGQTMLPFSSVSSSKSMMLPQEHSTS